MSAKTSRSLSRRQFLGWGAAGGAATLGVLGIGASGARAAAGARVVVVGGGMGGGTAARYIRQWAPELSVTLVEQDPAYIACPLSNLVVAGSTDITEITHGYDGLRAQGISLITDEAVVVDPAARTVRLADGRMLGYDRLILSPGVDMVYGSIPALNNAEAQAQVLHAWKAGPQTLALKRQLEDMRDGGVFVMHIPLAPFRCPPGPYERVCQVADYFKRAKPRAKIIVLDSNPDLVSKAALFKAAWADLYPGMIDYRPNSEIADVDVAGSTIKLVFDDVRGDVLNVIPPQRAGEIARASGLINANNRWCIVDWQTCESTAVKGIHVLGDATLSASLMPKSASMANQHGKLCAAAVIALLRGQPVIAAPTMLNTCYSFVDPTRAVHVTSVHQYSAEEKTMIPVKGAGGLSEKPSEEEGSYAWGWARNILADALG